MNDQFIQGVIFDWDRIDNDSYLKKIEALEVLKADFNKPVTFFVEKMRGKSTLLEAIAIAHGFNPEVEQRIMFSTHDTHSEL